VNVISGCAVICALAPGMVQDDTRHASLWALT
jgi:hypothetical protein